MIDVDEGVDSSLVRTLKIIAKKERKKSKKNTRGKLRFQKNTLN